MCNRRLADLGLSGTNIRSTALLAVFFGGVQYALTLWGYDLPDPVDWVPLLVMALVVGVFESIFFRGFIRNRLEAQFGPAFGIGTAAVLYGMYHIGYGMGGSELLFLTGLGVVYAVAFALARSLVVLWPLLTPVGLFYANVDAGDIELPLGLHRGIRRRLRAHGARLLACRSSPAPAFRSSVGTFGP